jgi:hypothetical protein
MSSSTLFTGMFLGGVIISCIGAASTYYLEEKAPSAKSLTRDFIIGAAMLAMILQLLPESSEYLIQYTLNLLPLSMLKTIQTRNVESDVEVKLGVPNF